MAAHAFITTFDAVHDQGKPLGFKSVEKHELAHDIQNNWYFVRK